MVLESELWVEPIKDLEPHGSLAKLDNDDVATYYSKRPLLNNKIEMIREKVSPPQCTPLKMH